MFTVATSINKHSKPPKAGGRACVAHCQGIPGPWADVINVRASVSCVVVSL